MANKDQTSKTASTKEAPKFDPKDVAENKGIAVVGYIIFFVPMLVKKDSKFAMFHAKQGMVIAIVSVGLSLVSWVPIIGWFGAPLFGLVLFIFAIMGII
ncbi:MAG: hypothetical protein GF335_02825, partial [Candidatus Moranbacteria bacterium]|nr:hypothetical protein [Candidatus Moranbacteria bacterium]